MFVEQERQDQALQTELYLLGLTGGHERFAKLFDTFRSEGDFGGTALVLEPLTTSLNVFLHHSNPFALHVRVLFLACDCMRMQNVV